MLEAQKHYNCYLGEPGSRILGAYFDTSLMISSKDLHIFRVADYLRSLVMAFIQLKM